MSSGTRPFPIAVDAMGSDLGPQEVVEGVDLALSEFSELRDLILVGQEEILAPLLKSKGLQNDSRITIHHAPTVISMDEKPKSSYKTKKDSSMIQAITLVKEGKAKAVVSCGNTGSLMFSGTLLLRKLPGIEKPALASIVPSQKHPFMMIDVGAQPETTAQQLVHNAILGSAYCKGVLPFENPRVGLLTNGTEEGKGTAKIAEAHKYLKSLDGLINYIGPIEGFDTFNNVADVVVCDGFTGNIVLKSLESCYKTIFKILKQELTASPVRKMGAAISQGAFKDIKRRLNPAGYSGAPLLGLRGLVVKAHGSSNKDFIKGAIGVTLDSLRHDQGPQIAESIEKANKQMKAGLQPELVTEKV